MEKNNLLKITFAIAIIGLSITIIGNFVEAPTTKKLYYLIGAAILLFGSLLDKNIFFTILQIVFTAGAAAAFLPLALFWKASIPIVLSILATIYFAFHGQFKDHLTWLSIASVVLGACGFAVSSPIMYFWAGAILSTYSFCAYARGDKLALIFGIFNIAFTLTALLSIYHVL